MNIRPRSRRSSRLAFPLGLSLLALLSSSRAALATTTIAGGTLANQTWTAAGSPYLIEGDVTVTGSLTIEAGTVVQFYSIDGLAAGVDPSRIELNVDGALTIAGTAASPVTLAGLNNVSKTSWYGISTAQDKTVNIDHAIIQNAFYGIKTVSASSLAIRNSTFHTCFMGLDIGNANIPTLLEGLEVRDNGLGINVESTSIPGFSQLEITNSIIRNNTNSGIELYAKGGVFFTATSTLNALITNSTIHANGSFGVVVRATTYGTTTALIRNSIITQNVLNGILRNNSSGTPIINIAYTNVWGNGANDLGTSSPGAGMLSLFPFYANPPTDLRILPPSVCIDGGDAAGAPALDITGKPRPHDGDAVPGARFDMGAHEYHPFCGDGVVNGAEACDNGIKLNGTYNK